MKFRAVLTERGVHALTKAFLPTLEKFGKACQVLLGPEEVHFVQTPLEADGAHVTVRFSVDVLFSPSSYRVQSRHFNLIAFAVDVALLLKALRSAAANGADTLEVKLTQKAVPLPGSAELENKPFLCFTARGAALSLVQDLPISKPCTPSEIDALVASKDVGALCPFYLDLSSADRLAAVVDKARALGSALQVALCKNGDLHIQVAESSVMLGGQFTGLAVYPQDARSEPDSVDRQLTAQQQLQAALQAEEAMAAHVQVKHLLKVLTVSQLSQPSQILLGVSEGGGHVHAMYVYRDPSLDAPYDDSMTLAFKLPVRDDD